MSRFNFLAKFTILVISSVTILYLLGTPQPTTWHFNRAAAGYQHVTTYYTRPPFKGKPAELAGDQQSSIYRPTESATSAKALTGTNTTIGTTADNIQDPHGLQGLEEPQEEFDDIPEETPEERHCSKSGTLSPNPIPKVVNFIWLNRTELSFVGYLAMRAALVSLQPDRLNLHYTDLNDDNEWLRKLHANITLVHHDLEQEYPKQVEENWYLAHISDVMRLDILHRDGGIYLDTDIIALQPFDDLLHSPKDTVLGNEGRGRFGLCNGIILGRKGAAFMNRWKESYSSFEVGEWNTHSVILPKEWSLAFPEDVCTLSPSAFFWPSWDSIQYMHEPLTDAQAGKFGKTLASHNGSMYPHQLAYHARHQVAPQLDDLTPEIVMTRNTRFNMLVRRFIE
ncbi:hypothetical protein N7519_001077 [Penicillium mononematosum]|uniref:uncharacterized protein n=1 Tax=Penicillium mononematosum TaxID=268346 RepID=UPI002547352C|nr:uncharacterized protein N7519_001077 [Penicillium mononematosum]KAJ6191056.1 hypothetical protein N7519_001077 [Penicillium mononematosum]